MAWTQHAEIEFLMPPVLITSYLHSELSQPRGWEKDVTKRKKKKNGEGKWEIWQSQSWSATQRQAFFDNHMLSSLSDQICQQETWQHDSPAEGTFASQPLPSPFLLTCTHIQSCVIYVHTYHKETCKHIRYVRKCYVPTLRIKQAWMHSTESISCTLPVLLGASKKRSMQWILRLTAEGVLVLLK